MLIVNDRCLKAFSLFVHYEHERIYCSLRKSLLIIRKLLYSGLFMAAKSISIDKQNKIVEMRNQGYKFREISKKLGVSLGAASKYSHMEYSQPLSAIPIRETVTPSVREIPAETQYKSMEMPEIRFRREISVDGNIRDEDAIRIIQARQGIPIPPPRDLTFKECLQEMMIATKEEDRIATPDPEMERIKRGIEELKEEIKEERNRKEHQAMNTLHEHHEEGAKNREPLVFPEERKITDGEIKAGDDLQATLLDDPGEWKDSDKEGMGDNSDEFPNDPNEGLQHQYEIRDNGWGRAIIQGISESRIIGDVTQALLNKYVIPKPKFNFVKVNLREIKLRK